MRSVRIVDRTFNDNTRRCVELLRMFRTEFQDVNFHLEIDPAKTGPSVVAQLAAARKGQFHIDAGLQSFSGDVMRNCDRRGSAERTGAGLAKLCALDGVAVHADLIAGLPGQTPGQVFDDLRGLVALKPAEIQLELLKLLPGTRLADEREKWGLVASPEPPYEIIRTAAMSEDDVFVAHWLSKLVDWFYGADQLRGVVQQASADGLLKSHLNDGSAGAFRPGGPASGMAPAHPLHGVGGRASWRAALNAFQQPPETLPTSTGSDFWLALCRFCRARHGLWMKPSLANRFALLKEFFDANGNTRLVHALQYAWMKHGLGPGGGICDAKPWKQGIPPDAVLVEGDASAEVAHWHVVDLGGAYLFGYGAGRCREAVAVYCLD
jgi:hypothetical protein